MTSVKEFRVDDEPTADSLGRGAFIFTDAYSIFDWGQMPDPIDQKGASLCTMGAFNFELLEEAGIPTHYRGVVEDGEVCPLADVSTPPTEMAIDLTQVPDLPHEGRSYDYETYHAAAGSNYLIPLEIVFRNRVPVGSSLRRRREPSELDLPFDTWPAEAVDLTEPIVEFSTKYEKGDRYLDRSEADAIAGRADLEDLESVARSVNKLLTDHAESAGLVHEDGKIECLFFDGEIRVADVVGTFDENRFSHEGIQLSKEVLRQYHKRTQPEWVEAVSEAKAAAKSRDIADWKTLCDREPAPLDDTARSAARDMYCAGTNAYIGQPLFDAPPLSKAVGAITGL